MSKINEDNILNKIKESIDSETPDVWEKIKSADKCKFNPEGQASKPKYTMIRRYSLAAACLLFIIVALNTKNFQYERNAATPEYNEVGRTTDLANDGLRPPSMPAEDAIGNPDIYKPIYRDAGIDEARKALGIDILLPTWLPEGFTQASSKLFSYDEKGSEPYMYSIEYRDNAGNILTLGITKFISKPQETRPAPMPYDPGTREIAPDEREKLQRGPALLPPEELEMTPPDYKEVQPSEPRDRGQSSPAFDPSKDITDLPYRDEPSLTPSTPKEDTFPKDGGGSSGNSGRDGSVSVEFVNIEIHGTTIGMTIRGSNDAAVLAAFWTHNEVSYNISTSGISQEDMIKILKSMDK
jgi:hypothetical protein